MASTMGVRAMAMTTLAATKLMVVASSSQVTACTRTDVPTLLRTNRAMRRVKPQRLHMHTMKAGPSSMGRLGWIRVWRISPNFMPGRKAVPNTGTAMT